jgi:hypothetical protein
VPSQQPNGQLQTQHSLDAGIYIINKHKLQASTGGRKKVIIIIIIIIIITTTTTRKFAWFILCANYLIQYEKLTCLIGPIFQSQ